MENAFSRRARSGARLESPLKPVNSSNDGDAEQRHDPGRIGKEIRARHHGNAPNQRHIGLLFLPVDRKAKTDCAPKERGDQCGRITQHIADIGHAGW